MTSSRKFSKDKPFSKLFKIHFMVDHQRTAISCFLIRINDKSNEQRHSFRGICAKWIIIKTLERCHWIGFGVFIFNFRHISHIVLVLCWVKKMFLIEILLHEKSPNTEFFWSVFSRIWTEYGDLHRKYPYSVQMRKNTDQKNYLLGQFLRRFRLAYTNFHWNSGFPIQKWDDILPPYKASILLTI